MSLKLNSRDRPKTSAVSTEDNEGCFKLVMVGGVGVLMIIRVLLRDPDISNTLMIKMII